MYSNTGHTISVFNTFFSKYFQQFSRIWPDLCLQRLPIHSPKPASVELIPNLRQSKATIEKPRNGQCVSPPQNGKRNRKARKQRHKSGATRSIAFSAYKTYHIIRYSPSKAKPPLPSISGQSGYAAAFRFCLLACIRESNTSSILRYSLYQIA